MNNDMDKNMRRQIIVDNFSYPYNKGLTGDKSYTEVVADNGSCIDNFKMEIKIENDIITDMHFDGDGCSMSTAATSILLKLIIGKTIKEALNIIYEYEKMINEEEYDSSVLGEANAYSDTSKQPSRKKCALLSYESIKEYLLNVLNKRICGRAVIIEDNKLILFYRKKIVDGIINEYYTLPGGGIEENETIEECVIRELKEEFTVDINIIKYLGNKEDDKTIQKYFLANIISGIPILGGEELERNSDTNYYEIRRIDINELDNINFRDKDIIKEYLNGKNI